MLRATLVLGTLAVAFGATWNGAPNVPQMLLLEIINFVFVVDVKTQCTYANENGGLFESSVAGLFSLRNVLSNEARSRPDVWHQETPLRTTRMTDEYILFIQIVV